MAYPQGINCRATAGFVTDPTNYDYSISSRGAYPWTTAQGNNVGWEVGAMSDLGFRDRLNTNDPRLAGTTFVSSGGFNRSFRFDLPSSGNYRIGLAAGDGFYANSVAVTLFDTASSLGALSTGTTSAPNTFKDATNTEYSAANWPGSQTLVSKTFSTTICRFEVTDLNEFASCYVEAGTPAKRWIFGPR